MTRFRLCFGKVTLTYAWERIRLKIKGKQGDHLEVLLVIPVRDDDGWN